MKLPSANPLSSLLFLYAETPLHVGSGSALGAVDLPIQRERMSHLPMVQGSGVKGALRAELKPRLESSVHRALFGRDAPSGNDSDDDDKAGAIAVLDARLLLFPMRTVWGGFAWVTSPLVLERLTRDLELADQTFPASLAKLQPADSGKALVSKDSSVAKGDKLFLEDFQYEAQERSEVEELATWLAQHALPTPSTYNAFRQRLKPQLVVVSDDELQFLAAHATEVVTRVRIDENTGTVADGALWTEEALPAESLLWSVVLISDEKHDKPTGKERSAEREWLRRDQLLPPLLQALGALSPTDPKAPPPRRLRLGGDRSIGRGIVGARLSNGGKP